MSSLTAESIESIDDVNANQWNDVVSQSDGGTVFHRTGWLRAIERGLDRDARHVVVRKGGNPVALCPNFLSPVDAPVDLPVDLRTLGLAQLSSVTPGFGGPLILADKDRSLELLFRTIGELCGSDAIVHRMRILDPGHLQYVQRFRSQGYRPSLLYCRFVVELDSYDRILEDMDGGRRKEIRKAKRDHDIDVVPEEVTRSTLRAFYEEYEKTIDRVDGTLYPRSFFDALADEFADRVEIFSARVDGQSAGKHLYLRDDARDGIHYFFSGVDSEYFEYSSPSVIHDHVLRWGVENGYSTYDFGGTSAHYDDGTYRYKKKFGGEIESVYEWERGFAPVRWNLYRSARRRYVSRVT